MKKLYDSLNDTSAELSEIIRFLTVTEMTDQQYTKLEQAGSTTDNRPGIQLLFTDLSFRSANEELPQYAAATLVKTMAQNHRALPITSDESAWNIWGSAPRRARTWFIKGGPGQGKSTLTQYIAQIQRAALVLSSSNILISAPQKAIVDEIRSISKEQGLWPETPRIPVSIELKDYAFWYGQRAQSQSHRALAYLAEHLSKKLTRQVQPSMLKRSFLHSRWLFIFDGLDEVPGDVKDQVAGEITYFVDDCLVGCGADAMIVCTSRPQGYSGQFSSLDAATVELLPLSREQALACAAPLLKVNRSTSEYKVFIETLGQAFNSPAIAQIMTTPLQSHIMAVIVRDGGRPPERRWQLFNQFYDVIKKRESNRNLPDKSMASLLREGDKLLRALHNRLGFELHKRAETSAGARTAINRVELKQIVTEVVSGLQERNVTRTVATLMKATTERLVLVNTPENGEHVRFDIRPLQEFFAAEYIYRHGDPTLLEKRVKTIASDAHWREVMHFLVSALVENGRTSDLTVVTDILLSMDSGDTQSIRAVNRRLAKGALISLRLLGEGVLEQDKQLRLKFRSTIIPLAAQNKRHVSGDQLQRHSLAWLQDVLISTLSEQAMSETMGAMLTLAAILPERDKRVSDVPRYPSGEGRCRL